MSTEDAKTTVAIVGGGPAGMMLGFLLARSGIKVTVLEKHADFLRDFRGDTVHPSTLEIMSELDLLKDFLKLPHEKLSALEAQVGNSRVKVADFSYLQTKCKFVAFVPQWDFLNFMASRAQQFPDFNLRLQTEVTGLIQDNDRVTGVIAKTPEGDELHLHADLVIGADGRNSVVRACAGLEVQDVGAPMDVLWMRISRTPKDPPQTLGRIGAGSFFVLLNRGEYHQCAFLIPKGTFDKYKEEGLDAFHQRIIKAAPFLSDRVHEIQSWDDIKLLTVKIDWLTKWYKPGLLCIGDSAHAMSPVGGVGINLAIQDAVAAANILYEPLKRGSCTEDDLKRVQTRRSYPTRMTQRLQVAIQDNVITPTLESSVEPTLPWLAHSLSFFPKLRKIPATLIGVGLRPEHVEIPVRRG